MLDKLFGSSLRAKVLGWLFLHPDERYFGQKYYQANPQCPVFAELEGLVRKTTGLADILSDALKPLSKKIKVAFIYGSMATGSVNRQSDVDLMVIGSSTFAEVVAALGAAQDELGREINPSTYPVDEFRRKVSSGHHFINTVMKTPKIFLIGDADELKRLAQE